MTRIKMHISNVKLPFYPSCEVKYGLQNRVSTSGWSFLLERSGFFWVWSGWRSVVGVVIFVGEGWVFLGLIGVEIGGRFCTV